MLLSLLLTLIVVCVFCVGKMCIEVGPTDKVCFLSEELCIGCGICVKKCPFEAIQIINLPSNLEKEQTHRYSANSFKLHRLIFTRNALYSIMCLSSTDQSRGG